MTDKKNHIGHQKHLYFIDLNNIFFNSDKYIIPIYQRNFDWQEEQIEILLTDIIYKFFENINRKKNNKNNNDHFNDDYYLGSLILFKNDDNICEYEVIDGQQRLVALYIILCHIFDFINNKLDCQSPESNNLINKEIGLFEPPEYEAQDSFNGILKNMKNIKNLDDYLNRLKQHEQHEQHELDEINTLISAFKTVQYLFKKIFDEASSQIQRKISDSDYLDFLHFFLENLKFIKIILPEKTDINRYFEIMNTRGEQLIPHEILKSHFIAALKKDDSDENNENAELFNAIWTACSDMSGYIQHNINKININKNYSIKMNDNELANIANFTNNFKLSHFLEVKTKEENINKGTEPEKINHNLQSIIDSITNKSNNPNNFNDQTIEYYKTENKEHNIKNFFNNFNEKTSYSENNDDKNKTPNKKESIINFPNFLLQVRKLQAFITHENDDTIILDDKHLLSSFSIITDKNSTDEVKKDFSNKFGALLLWARIFFDKYIIKNSLKEKQTENWTLKSDHDIEDHDDDEDIDNTIEKNKNGDLQSLNKEIIKLQTAFHVSYQNQTRKFWLHGALIYLWETIRKNNYNVKESEINYLRFLRKLAVSILCYNYLTDKDSEKSYEEIVSLSVKDHDKFINDDFKINKDNIKTYPFLFNFLDYILWNENPKKSFHFSTARTSLEHFSPREPIEGQQRVEHLDSFGNLCLVTSDLNSSLGNKEPGAKIEIINLRINKGQTQSIKLEKMVKIAEKNKYKFKDEEILEHEAEMLDILEKKINEFISEIR
jgi:uncharacterized protein with ParB-like and HNH nuclease domain